MHGGALVPCIYWIYFDVNTSLSCVVRRPGGGKATRRFCFVSVCVYAPPTRTMCMWPGNPTLSHTPIRCECDASAMRSAVTCDAHTHLRSAHWFTTPRVESSYMKECPFVARGEKRMCIHHTHGAVYVLHTTPLPPPPSHAIHVGAACVCRHPLPHV